MTVTYAHEPFTDFTEAKNKTAFGESLAFVNTQLGKHYPLVINGEKIEADRKIFPLTRQIKKRSLGTRLQRIKSLLKKRCKPHCI